MAIFPKTLLNIMVMMMMITVRCSKLMVLCVTSGWGAPGGRHPGRGGPGGAGAAGGALAGHPAANIFKVFQIFLQICVIQTLISCVIN